MLSNNATVLKYIDFGLAKEIECGLKTNVGSFRYKAPELFNLVERIEYTKAADIWYFILSSNTNIIFVKLLIL